MRRIRSHLTYANLMSTLAVVLVIGGGTAYAANTVFSSDIVDGQVRTADIGDLEVRAADVAANSLGSAKIADGSVKNADLSTGASSSNTIADGGVQGIDVANDSLGGADIDESTLQNVNASKVGGFQFRKINFQVPDGTGPTPVLDLGGLQITAECQNFGDGLDVKAFTSKNDASMYYVGFDAGGANDADDLQSIGSTAAPEGRFDIGEVRNIDNATPGTPGTGDISTGALNYSAPDGSVVVTRLAFDDLEGGGCALTGIATGG